MKKFNLKKIAMMGLAAMMAVSAASMSVFASDLKDNLVATIPNSDGETVYVYESDLIDGALTIESDGLEITVGVEDDLDEVVSNADGLMGSTSKKFRDYYPSSSTNLYLEGTQSLTFSADTTDTVYSPNYYLSGNTASTNNTIKYTFKASATYNTSVKGNVIANGITYSVNLYNTSNHYISVGGLGSADRTYASVSNSGYNGTASGTCKVEG